MTDYPQIETLARELHASRAEPDPAFARVLDRRAEEWPRERPPRRWVPSLRVAAPAIAVAAAAVVAVVAIVGGDGEDQQLAVRVVSEQAGGGEALSAEPRRDAPAPAEGIAPSVRVGEPVVVQYSVTEAGRAEAELGGRHAKVEIPSGRGRLEISTEGFSPGTYEVEVVLPSSEQRTRIEILPRR